MAHRIPPGYPPNSQHFGHPQAGWPAGPQLAAGPYGIPPQPPLGSQSHGASALHHQLSAADKQTLTRVGQRTRSWGLLALASGVLMIAAGVFGLSWALARDPGLAVVKPLVAIVAAVVIPLGLLNGGIGGFYLRAAGAFRDLTATSAASNAVPDLMCVLIALRLAFQMEVVFGAASLLLSAAVIAWLRIGG